MTSYTSQQLIPMLSPVTIYKEGQRPLTDQVNDLYISISDIVNDKKRADRYLQEEVITNDVWVDDKAVFRLTVPTGALTAGATKNIPHGITTIETLVNVRVMVTNGTNQRLIGYANPVAANSGAVDVDATNVVITLGAGFGASYSGYAILEYTKL